LLRLDEGDAVMRHLRAATSACASIRVDAAERFFACARGCRRPRSQAQDHRPAVRRGVRRRVAKLGRGRRRPRRVSGAGHHLSRRDRIGWRQDRQGARHQESITTSAACRRT
jgi:hypothetical protein